jgi:RNA processing factor Prp31
VDEFRGTRDDTVLKSLDGRLEEIKAKYAEAPKPKTQKPFRSRELPPQRREDDRRRGAKRGKGKAPPDFRSRKRSG